MVLRNQIEWALHCCSVLAACPEGVYLSTKDLAEFHGVPKEYLSKALQNLSHAGIVETNLGPRGGYKLARPADKITFLDIVEAIEGRRSTFNCTEIRKNNPCRNPRQKDTPVCAIAKVMYEADQAWRNHLKSVRLSDLLATLEKDLPKDFLERVAKWIEERVT